MSKVEWSSDGNSTQWQASQGEHELTITWSEWHQQYEWTHEVIGVGSDYATPRRRLIGGGEAKTLAKALKDAERDI